MIVNRYPAQRQGGPGELLTMADGSKWFHPYSGGAPTCERKADAMHYAMTYQEARADKLASGAVNDWIDPQDFRELPARAALCRTGDGHAQVIRDWSKVTCAECLERKPVNASETIS